MKQGIDRAEVFGNIFYYAYDAVGGDDAHVFFDAMAAAFVEGEVVVDAVDGIGNDLGADVSVLLLIEGVVDDKNLVVGFDEGRLLLVEQEGVLFGQGLVDGFEVEIVGDGAIHGVDPAGKRVAGGDEDRLLVIVGIDNKNECNHLQEEKQESIVVLQKETKKWLHKMLFYQSGIN